MVHKFVFCEEIFNSLGMNIYNEMYFIFKCLVSFKGIIFTTASHIECLQVDVQLVQFNINLNFKLADNQTCHRFIVGYCPTLNYDEDVELYFHLHVFCFLVKEKNNFIKHLHSCCGIFFKGKVFSSDISVQEDRRELCKSKKEM